MIEKFSDEELMIIEKELEKRKNGLPTLKGEMRNYLESKLKDTLEDFENKIPRRIKESIDCIIKLADMSFNNYSFGEKRRQISWIPFEYRQEYVAMCNEIIEIVKKHNRKWGGEERSSE